MDLVKQYQTQVSLTEWLEKLNHPITNAFRAEDNDKRPRLDVLLQIIGLPYDKPNRFSARAVADFTPEIQKFISEHGEELCALRLVPIVADLPKIRNRGFSIKKSLDWFKEQKFDPDKYIAEFVPHAEKDIWSTIFIINEHGIFGEIIHGGHNLLTQGFYGDYKPIAFAFDWTNWHLSEDNGPAKKEIITLTNYLKVDDKDKRNFLTEKLQSKFYHNYLAGYFETSTDEDVGVWFKDYNRILGDIYKDYTCLLNSEGNFAGKTILGQTGSGGRAQGKVRIIKTKEDLPGARFDDGEVLVCDMTAPEYLPLMVRSSAIITDMGGVLSHAAIICRELKKPAVVGTKNATQVLKDGDLVEVDATNGLVRRVE